MVCRLNEADVLEDRNEAAVFPAAPMRPLVNLVGVDADGDDQYDLPDQAVQQPRHKECDTPHHQENVRALEPGVSREVGWLMMVEDVGPSDQLPGDRPMLPSVGILQPVEEPR